MDTVERLVHGDIRHIDNKEFNKYKSDEILMDELAKQILETFYSNDMNSPIALELKDILKKSDKELYGRIRGRHVTLRQLKARSLEKVNGNRFQCIVLDDIRDGIREEYLNLDHQKVDEYLKAAFGKGLNDIQPDGPDGVLKDLEPWQTNMKCLRSLKNYGIKKSRSATARSKKTGGWAHKKTIPRSTSKSRNVASSTLPITTSNPINGKCTQDLKEVAAETTVKKVETPGRAATSQKTHRDNELGVSSALYDTLTNRLRH